MSAPTIANVKRLVIAAIITLPVGLALFIGGIAAIAAKAVPLGGVLLVLAILSVGIGCVLLLRVRSATRAITRDMQAKRQADFDALRDQAGGGANC